MKKNNNSNYGIVPLQQAEGLHKKRFSNNKHKLSETEIKQLINELEVRQIELEMQNSELLKTNEQLILNEKQIEEKLLGEKYRLNSIIEGTNIGTWEWNIQTGETLFNERWANIIGYTLNELDPISINTWVKYVHPDDLIVSGQLLQRHFAGELNFYTCQARMKHKDGSWVWVLDRGKVNEWSTDGKPLNMSGTHMDITEFKKYEDTIRQNDESLRTISLAIEQSHVIYDIADLDGNIVFVNPKYTEVTGYTLEEVIGQNSRILKSGYTSKSEYKKLWETIKKGDIWSGTFLNKKKNGETYWESAVISPVKNKEGEITHFLSVKEDITLLKQAEDEKGRILEDLLKHNKILEQFAYIVSHNLRTPVANILGLNYLLKLKNTNKSEKEIYEYQIIKSLEKLDEVINDLDTILHIRNQIHNNDETLYFIKIIKDISTSMEQLFKAQNVELILDFKQVEKIVSIKPYLHSIFLNLISNSIKYRKAETAPIIKISTQKKDDKVIIVYKDNGIGIDLSLHGQNVFGLYKRFNAGHAEGKGVGLYLVKTQIESLGGKISVSSQPGIGTKFTIILNDTQQIIA